MPWVSKRTIGGVGERRGGGERGPEHHRGEKMTRRSVEVSVPPPVDSYLVQAGRMITSPSPSTSIDEESTMS
jgi:hypothetical protein